MPSLAPPTASAPSKQPFVLSQRSKGQRGYTPIRFAGSLRGEGVLAPSGRKVRVVYQVDLYDGAAGRTASGSLEGAVGRWSAGDEARLRLADGSEVTVLLQETDADGAVFETRGAFAPPGGARRVRKPAASR